MSGRALARCGLSESEATLIRSLEARGVSTAAALLTRTPIELSHELGLSPSAAKELVVRVSSAVCPQPTTAAAMCRLSASRPPLPSGLPPLDRAMRGGVPAGSITELVGPAGVGKTQLCLQLAARAALGEKLDGPRQRKGGGGPDEEAQQPSVFYIDTENKFSSRRFVEIAQGQLCAAGVARGEAHAAARSCQSRIYLLRVTSLEDMLERTRGLEVPCIDLNVRLIVVDSIANLVRTSTAETPYASQEVLGNVAAAMKKLAEALAMPVIMTNQVAARFGDAPSHFGQGEAEGSGAGPGDSGVGAALGTSWAHAVNTRLVLQPGYGGRGKEVCIAKSPVAASVSFSYRVTEDGLQMDSWDHCGRGATGSCMEHRISVDDINYMPS